MLACLSYAEKIIECFDFETGRWTYLTERPGSSSVYGSEAISADGSTIFALGGVQSRYVNRVTFKIWSDIFLNSK